MVRSLVLSSVVVLVCAGIVQAVQQVAGPAAPQTLDPRQLLAARTLALGQCNAELGPLQQLQAQVIAGQIVSLEQVRQQIEKANPGKTITATFLITDRKEE